MSQLSRLSAMPSFLRGPDFWAGALNPLARSRDDNKYVALSVAAASHRWDFSSECSAAWSLSSFQEGVIDVAQAILERGIWTLPSWTMEQRLAARFNSDLGWELIEEDETQGTLGYSIKLAPTDESFRQGLVTARWEVEGQAVAPSAEDIWRRSEPGYEGSDAEFRLLEDVLVPVLGYPLVDYLRPQPSLPTLGLDPIDFVGQRADFCLDTFRGLKLVVELDGSQHASPEQAALDSKRDKALRKCGWKIWRPRTSDLIDPERLKSNLRELLVPESGRAHWGTTQLLNETRSRSLMSCVWGATVSARIQFLLLEALRRGILPWDEPWNVGVVEGDTDIGLSAIEDFADWFGRIRQLYGLGEFPGAFLLRPGAELREADIVIDVGVRDPTPPEAAVPVPLAWSRPANQAAPSRSRKFSVALSVPTLPSTNLLSSFVRDWFRKTELREGQEEIISRILQRQDVIGLLPTGGGKSLTYHLCGLLLGGLTVYVSPLKSLLQDQRERLIDSGIDQVTEISSAITLDAKAEAGRQLAEGETRYLLVSPERFLIAGFRLDLASFRARYGEVCQVVVDECHCVSEWGHDFRPAYLSLSRIARDRTNRLGISAPLIALTGTASSIVLADVQRELGIVDSAAVVRARRLDRPEITMTCEQVQQTEKHSRLRALIEAFDGPDRPPRDGHIVFTRFIGGMEGVLAITSSVLGYCPPENVRFYCGGQPAWNKFAAFKKRKTATTISEDEALALVPDWALTADGTLEKWDKVKARVQRDFISGLSGSFQLLIATNAFGMGIDKPSVRRVVHFVTPQSPEAYYQEVGRAGRDRKPSDAVLLFSDEDATVTDQIFSPSASIEEARSIYKGFLKKNKYGGGDFLRTFFFHENRFAGPDAETRYILDTLAFIRARVDSGDSLICPYTGGFGDESDPKGGGDWRQETNLEYAVVRLVLLGVLKDYTKDYNARQLSFTLNPEWTACRNQPEELAQYLATNLTQYIQRYQVQQEIDGLDEVLASEGISQVESRAARAMVRYVYEQVERKRRQASRQMLELARIGVADSARFRENLMLYLQVSEKFTRDLEALAKSRDVHDWEQIVARVDNRDEMRELHGACQRVLESYPTHPGLLTISSVTRLEPSESERSRSGEEFQAALEFCQKVWETSDAFQLGEAALRLTSELGREMVAALRQIFGPWLLRNGFRTVACEQYLDCKPVRDSWLAEMVSSVRSSVPDVKGL